MPALPANLTTNEVKDCTGTEVEFNRLSQEGRTLVFAKNGESPAQPFRLKVSHQESGSGTAMVRRSLVRLDKTFAGSSGKPVTVSAYCVVVLPIGDIPNFVECQNTLAGLISFLATTGAGTTVLFDCSGNGASALINGSL